MATPEGWSEAHIRELLDLETPGFWGSEPVGDGDTRVVRATNLRAGSVDLSYSNVALRSFPERKRDQKRLRNGDIVLERSGGGPKQPVGRVAIFEKDDDSFSVSNFMQLLRPKLSRVVPRWLAYALHRLHVTGVTEQLQQATTGIRNLNYQDYLAVTLPLPPLSEQRRIAAILSSVDEIIEKTEAVIAQLQVVKKALMQKLLTPPSGGDSGAWRAAALGDCVCEDRPICYGILMPGTGHPAGVPVVKVKNIRDGVIAEGGLLLTSPAIDEQYRRSRIRGGDLLVTIRGTTGRIARVPATLTGANITQDSARLSIRDGICADYVFHVLAGEDLQQQIRDHTRGQAVQGINIGDVRKLRLQLPPYAKQVQIAGVLSDLDTRAAAERNVLATLRSAKASLAASLLSGELRVIPDRVST